MWKGSSVDYLRSLEPSYEKKCDNLFRDLIFCTTLHGIWARFLFPRWHFSCTSHYTTVLHSSIRNNPHLSIQLFYEVSDSEFEVRDSVLIPQVSSMNTAVGNWDKKRPFNCSFDLFLKALQPVKSSLGLLLAIGVSLWSNPSSMLIF